MMIRYCFFKSSTNKIFKFILCVKRIDLSETTNMMMDILLHEILCNIKFYIIQ